MNALLNCNEIQVRLILCLRVAAILFGFSLGAEVQAQAPARTLDELQTDLRVARRDLLDLQLEEFVLKARVNGLDTYLQFLDEQSQSQQPNQAITPGFKPTQAFKEEILQALSSESATNGRLDGLRYFQARADQGQNEARQALSELLKQEQELQLRAAKEGAEEFDPGSQGVVGSIAQEVLNGLRAYWWIYGLVLLLFWGLTAHQSRIRFRKWWHTKISKPVLILMGLGLSSLAGCSSPESLLRDSADDQFQRQQLMGEISVVSQQQTQQERVNTDLQGKVNALEAEARAKGVELLSLGLPLTIEEEDWTNSTFVENELEVQDQLRNILVDASVARELAQVAEDRLFELQKTRPGGSSPWESRQIVPIAAGCIQILIAFMVLLVAVLPFSRVIRQRQERLKKESSQCPRCLAPESLVRVENNFTNMRNEAMFNYECQVAECGQITYPEVIGHPRTCFPTVGVRNSGKSHWLFTSYQYVRNTTNLDQATRALIQKVTTPDDYIFEDLVVNYLEKHRNLPATQYDTPKPILCYVKDADSFARKSTLVNLFDFSGEVMFRDLALDPIRQRSLLFDGFVLFLDPTQVMQNQEGELTINDQIDALARFHDELQRMRGIPLGVPIDVPIAVCISKIDMLVNRNPMGTRAVRWIEELRETMSFRTTRHLVEERSKFTAEELPSMFPGWDIPRMLRERFGSRFMFFPVSAVGIEDGELGEEDLSRRTWAPFGIMEPLLWLLHMHGYRVFH